MGFVKAFMSHRLHAEEIRGSPAGQLWLAISHEAEMQVSVRVQAPESPAEAGEPRPKMSPPWDWPVVAAGRGHLSLTAWTSVQAARVFPQHS